MERPAKRHKPENVQSQSYIEELPTEILEHIILFYVESEQHKCFTLIARLVCKKWKALLPAVDQVDKIHIDSQNWELLRVCIRKRWVPLTNWLLDHGCRYGQTILVDALKCGPFSIYERILKDIAKEGTSTYYDKPYDFQAAASGDIGFVCELINNRMLTVGGRFQLEAARAGHLKLFEWSILKFGAQDYCDGCMVYAAIDSGKLPLLQCALAHRYPIDFTRAFIVAARTGAPNCIYQFLLDTAYEQRGHRLFPTQSFFRALAKYNRFEALQWMMLQYEFGYIRSISDRRPQEDDVPCAQAIVNGNVKMLKYLVTKGFSINLTSCILAARYGRLDALKWLIDNGYPADKTLISNAAIFSKHLHILKWVARNLPGDCNLGEWWHTTFCTFGSSSETSQIGIWISTRLEAQAQKNLGIWSRESEEDFARARNEPVILDDRNHERCNFYTDSVNIRVRYGCETPESLASL